MKHNSGDTNNSIEEGIINREIIQSFIDESNDGIIISTIEGNIMQWNILASEIFPQLKDQSKNISEILSVCNIKNTVWNNLNEIISNSTPLYTEFYNKTQSSASFYEVCLKLMTNKKVLITIKNITPRKIAQNKLEENNIKLKKVNKELDKKKEDLSEAVTDLLKSKEYYRSLLQESIDGIIISDFTGRILTINNQALEYSGYNIDEIKNIPFTSLFTDFELKRNPLRYDQIKEGEKIAKERYLKRKDNTQIPIEMRSRLVSGDKIQTIIRDISKEKQAKLELIKSEKKYRELVENLNDVIFECDKNFNLTFSNGALEFLGYSSPDEIYGESLMTHIHNEDKEIISESLNKITPQKNIKEEFRFEISRNKYIWVRLNIKGKYEKGELTGYNGTISDISKQKDAELNLKEKNEELLVFNEEYLSQNEELRTALEEIQEKNTIIEETVEKLKQSKEAFQTITENTPDIISRLDLDANYKYISKNIKKYLNLNYTEIIDKNILEVPFEKDFIYLFLMHFENAKNFKKTQSYTYEYSIEKTNRYFEVRLVPEFNKTDEVTSILSIIRDITKQKRTEKALIRSKEKAEDADKLKTAFLANMSHEIRTPLNGIIGFSNLLYDEEVTAEEKKEYIDTINNCSNQLLSIISDIIDISKIEAKQLEINKETCNINSILRSQKSLFEKEKIRLGKQNITLSLSLPNENSDFLTVTDESRIKQILTNLLGNALKFTEHGIIEFGYTLEEDKILFHVSDTGLGIPEKDQKIIFERFRQSNPNRDQLYGGTGLGLSICKGLLELLDGNIWVESKIEYGSTFYFTIPLIEVKKKRLIDNTTIDKEKKDSFEKNILIIEDTFFSQQYFKALFKHTGYNLTIAGSAEEGISILTKKQNYDLILMDIRLPGISGLEAVPILRKINNTVPIIAQTANAMADDKQKSLNAGCNDYIAKPIRKKDLFNLINKYINSTK